MNESDRVLIETEGHIAVVRLNRPDKHNGLDKQMMDELMAASKSIRKNRAIRAVVMTANGESFCAGLDFSFVAKNPGFIARYFLKLPWSKDNRFQRVAHCWRALPIPVIACVHGNCFGGGLQLILGCDFRIATPQANLSIMEMKWGLIPDMSGMVNLSRLTREDIAKELTMTGRQFSGIEAKEYGLITELSDQPLSRAMALASQIVEQSPDAVAVAKQLIQASWQVSERSAMLLERWHQLRILFRRNNRIAMKNGLSKAGGKRGFENRRVR